MRFIDEEEIEMQKMKAKKMKKLIVISIILLSLLGMTVIGLLIYRLNNPAQITTYIDGVKVSKFDEILDFSTDENGKTQIYIPIRDFASYLNAVNSEFGYQTFKGDYNPKTEDDNKCYIIRAKYEMAMFTKKSKTIYKLNLENGSKEYEECTIDKDVFDNNGKLYASVDGIEKGYNVLFEYNEDKKMINIYTMDYLMTAHEKALEGKKIGNYGELKISSLYSDYKSIFEDLIIVEAENGKYGIIKDSDYSSFILEPQYDKVSFVSDSSAFLVESNGKVGLFTKDGKRKIDLVYDKITSMGQDSKLYVVESNGMYGVVDENGKIIIYPEYEQIGIDANDFSYNDVKNGYILLNKLIPVKQEDKWALFDTKGNRVSDGFKYNSIGCSSVNSGNKTYPLLQIPDYNVIVVSDEYDKYAFMDINGNDSILNFLFDQIYIKFSEGKASYWMTYRGKEYEVLKYLKKPQDNSKQNQATNSTTNNVTNTTTNSTTNSVTNNTTSK